MIMKSIVIYFIQCTEGKQCVRQISLLGRVQYNNYEGRWFKPYQVLNNFSVMIYI